MVNKFSRSSVRVSDKVRVVSVRGVFDGVLMPGLPGLDCLVLKLGNGYNVAIPFNEVKRVELVSRGGGGKVSSGRVVKQVEGLPLVSLVATGGTIASRVDYSTGGVTALSSPEELLELNPRISELARIRFLHPFQVLSEDMSFSHYERLGRVVKKELLDDEVRGVVITHGTDTLHFTSAALSFMFQNLRKPIAVVGAQRSSDRGSADGVLNLLCAVKFALSKFNLVGVVMHNGLSDESCGVIRGVKVRKMHTERRDAFRPVNDDFVTIIHPDKPVRGGFVSDGDPVFKIGFCRKVAMVKAYPNSDPEVVDFLVSKGVKGLVVEGTGFGHVPVSGEGSWVESLRNAVDSGVVVVMTSQCLYGRTSGTVYSNGRLLKGLGVVYASDMLPEVAYVKLAWLLKHYPDNVVELMVKNLVGEINDRLLFDQFLK